MINGTPPQIVLSFISTSASIARLLHVSHVTCIVGMPDQVAYWSFPLGYWTWNINLLHKLS